MSRPVEYTQNARLSPFEERLVKHLRQILKHGWGEITVRIAEERVTGYEPRIGLDRTLKQFAEAQSG